MKVTALSPATLLKFLRNFKRKYLAYTMRILVLGSSMTLPSDELTYNDTWLYRLGHEFPQLEVVDKCQRESSARRLNAEGPTKKGKDTLEYYAPDVVITQIGVTDAAPRLLKRNGMLARILHHTPRKISKMVYDFLRKHRGRQLKYCDLTPDQLQEQFDFYCKRAQKLGVKVFIIEICHATTKVTNVSPHYNECMDLFNSRLHKVTEANPNARIIEVISADDLSDFQTDGIHLTASGQSKLFKNIIEALTKDGIL